MIRITPAKPQTRPKPWLAPRAACPVSAAMAKAKSGAVVVRIEARPLETCCSPQLMSRKGSARLMTLCTRKCGQILGLEGSDIPRQRFTAIRTGAASAMRPAVRLAGGIVSIAILMRVKEPPQSSASSRSNANSVRNGRDGMGIRE
jgi:hypothetical protein